jgi:hypothetical protein
MFTLFAFKIYYVQNHGIPEISAQKQALSAYKLADISVKGYCKYSFCRCESTCSLYASAKARARFE